MGCNIGTSVTNTIVSFGQVSNRYNFDENNSGIKTRMEESFQSSTKLDFDPISP